MIRTKSIGVAFLVNSLGIGGADRTLNSLDDARFKVALAYLKRYEHLLAQVTPDRASQVWCADFGRGWDFYGLKRLSKWLRKCKFRSSKSSTAPNWHPTRTGKCG